MGIKEVTAEPEVKDGKEGYKVVYEDGYTSWSPKDAFEKAYRENGKLSFSHALDAIKEGYADIFRSGWNGTDMYITLIKAGNATHRGFPMQDCLALKNNRSEMQPGWVPSQGDLLAEDWTVRRR